MSASAEGMILVCADALIENLTVFEMLLYTAELKLDMRMKFLDKCKKVQKVIDQLALNTCRDTRIGSALTRGISGTTTNCSLFSPPNLEEHLRNWSQTNMACPNPNQAAK